MPWSEEKKVTIKRALTWDYTSSDESDVSEDENGSCLHGYLVKKLTWERSALQSVKKALDKAYLTSLSPRVRANVLPRRVHPQPSGRSPPVNGLGWAVRVSEPETPAGTSRMAAVDTPASTSTCRSHDQPSEATPRIPSRMAAPRAINAAQKKKKTGHGRKKNSTSS